MAKVLVVEDDQDLNNAYCIILRHQGHEVVSAFDGKEALEKLKDFKPNLILLDLLMPIMGGLEFLKRWHPMDKKGDVKVLIFTNMENSPEVNEAYKLGAQRCIIKSWTAFVYGDANNFNEGGYPKGGMGALEKVATNVTGLHMHYYALVDYKALRQAVNAVGGIDFTVDSEDPRGLYDPNIDWETHGPLVKLSNGKHHLDGRQALDLARARGDAYNSYGFAGSDFTRTENQRKLLIALKSKAVSAGTLANPAHLSSLFDAVGNNVKTDFKLSEVRRLYDLSKLISGNNIQSLSLNQADGKNLLMSYLAPGGQSALAPAAGIDDFSDIHAFIERKTSSNGVVQEAAKVVVLNGTTVDGLANTIKKKLTDRTFIVSDVGDAGNIGQLKTVIINNSGSNKPATATALRKLFGNHITTQNPYKDVYDADFIIVLGKDQAVSSAN